jgi:hypothetical protein
MSRRGRRGARRRGLLAIAASRYDDEERKSASHASSIGRATRLRGDRARSRVIGRATPPCIARCDRESPDERLRRVSPGAIASHRTSDSAAHRRVRSRVHRTSNSAAHRRVRSRVHRTSNSAAHRRVRSRVHRTSNSAARSLRAIACCGSSDGAQPQIMSGGLVACGRRGRVTISDAGSSRARS